MINNMLLHKIMFAKPQYLIWMLMVLLSGCASVNPVYISKTFDKTNQLNQVLIMIEYLELKDDTRNYWNFDEEANIKQQDLLYQIAHQMLLEKGYEVSSSSLKTSGLVVARDYYVDHYINKKPKPQPIAPPYIIRSIDLNDDHIYALESLLATLTEPVSSVMSDYRAFIKNNYKEQTQNIDISDDIAILVVQSYRPRTTVFSNVDVGFSFSNGGNGAFAGIGGRQQFAKTSAYFIHKGSGDVIWANHTDLIRVKSQQKFFSQLPKK